MDEQLTEGVDFVVVWNGAMSREGLHLLPPRDSRASEGGPREHRKYSWTGNHTKEKRGKRMITLEVRKAVYASTPQTRVVDIPKDTGDTPTLGWAERQLQQARDQVDTGETWD